MHTDGEHNPTGSYLQILPTALIRSASICAFFHLTSSRI